MSEKQQRLILIDGHALAYRAYFGMPDTFSTPDGEKTNAVYGFMNMILAVWKDFDPDYFIVTFDKGDTFRHEMFAEYKGTREKMPDDLYWSLGRIRDIVEGFNDRIVELDGYEADDVIGTLATKAQAAGLEAVMIALNEEVAVDSAQAVAAERRARINAQRGPYLSRDQVTQQIVASSRARAAPRSGCPTDGVLVRSRES